MARKWFLAKHFFYIAVHPTKRLIRPLTYPVVVALSCGTGLFVLMGGYPAIIAAGNAINVATALGFSCMVVAAVWSAI